MQKWSGMDGWWLFWIENMTVLSVLSFHFMAISYNWLGELMRNCGPLILTYFLTRKRNRFEEWFLFMISLIQSTWTINVKSNPQIQRDLIWTECLMAARLQYHQPPAIHSFIAKWTFNKLKTKQQPEVLQANWQNINLHCKSAIYFTFTTHATIYRYLHKHNYAMKKKCFHPWNFPN